MLSKVPEITVWFWIIKILCTTVGESFADWINMTLGVGLDLTALLFTGILIAVLGWQVALRRYVPFVYWLTVVVVSVTGTLYTDILTDDLGIPLALSTAVFAVILATVFAIWWRSQRTLSIHSITTTPRELFYWLAILVTFALGTATGDWILELTGWSPGVSVLLPAALIIAVTVGWKLGANPVLAFWLAYILTRPLGANLGDWLGFPPEQGGVGLGVALTSIIFLAAILAVVIYLTATRADTIEKTPSYATAPSTPRRQRATLSFYGVVAVASIGLLAWASAQPHSTAAASEEGPATSVTLAAGQSAIALFPRDKVSRYQTIATDTLALLAADDQANATAHITDLETAWDEDQTALQPLDNTGWTYLDGKIDTVLTELRAPTPDITAEKNALNDFLAALH
ncbi:hypothetical protein CVS47_00346 [Microbacterium lemovicicum]|uniref:Membrane-anchored protein n=2 Tax=Microbacterium lemovicicum TaxID=1072463 RepID=A0A3S9W6X1_9MICO|nr:hypothetical protein CVS47_00346 [Microbacterium lemovicicum]